MKKIRYFLLSSLVSLLGACTTDVGSAPKENYEDRSPSYNAQARGDLPDCTDDREGLVVHVNEHGKDYACSKGYWVALRSADTDKKLYDVNEDTEAMKALHEKFKRVKSEKITDSRDGKVYKVIILKDLVWMAENLDYETEYSRTNPKCDDYGIKCGRYYRWDDAAYGGDNYSSVCPEGMRMPTEEDVEKLVAFIGGIDYGYVLKSKDYWDYSDDAPQGTDEFGFNAYPAGYKEYLNNYISYFGVEAAFWTGEKYGYHSSYAITLYYHNSIIGTTWGPDWDNYMNVRCVGDW